MKFSERTKTIITEVICLLYVLLFVYAAISKLLDFNTFQNQLGQSPLLSAYAGIVSWSVPLLELAIATMLIIPKFRKIGLYAAFTLMVMFTTYIFIILNFSDFVPCSCGGVLEKLGWTEHLIFNIIFILLAALALFLLTQNTGVKPKKTSFTISVLAVLGSMVVTVLFLSSEKQIKRNNAFIRRYIPHPVEKIGQYDLEYNSYYIAGVDGKTIYLGNYTAPLSMTTLDTSLKKMEEFQIAIDSMHLPYRRVNIAVAPPYFYVGDGTVPILFKGRTRDWKANIMSYKDVYFNQFIVADSTRIGISTISSKTQSNTLGLIKKTKDSIDLKLHTEILSKQIDGKFGTDGLILWNEYLQGFIYTYFYQNSYEVTDKNLSHQFTGKTIDTISKPILDIAHYTTKNQYKLSGNSVFVNRQTATYGNYLYIHSTRLGRYEDENALRYASIIDIYNLTDNTYAFSFYLYHQIDKKLRQFMVYKDLLVAIVDDTLWLYRLKPKHFDIKRYTAQYQDEGRTPGEKSRP